jgi:hypothetical protein
MMKHILAAIALLAATPAMAQIDKAPWYGVPANPTPALKPIPLPPPEFDREYKGQLVVTKWNDYSLIRHICKEPPRPSLAHTVPLTASRAQISLA